MTLFHLSAIESCSSFDSYSLLLPLSQSGLPPLIPKVDAILVLDGDGNRLAGKYYGDFLKSPVASEQNEWRSTLEQQVHGKISALTTQTGAAEIVTLPGGRTVVVCGGAAAGHSPNDCVRVVHIGPANESELVLAYLCEGMYDALCQLMGGTADRTMVLDNLELVFLLIDEHCDGGIILEVDGHKLASAVLLRDEESSSSKNMNHPAEGGAGAGGQHQYTGGHGTDLTIGQALRQAREQIMAGMTSRDGM
jgi:coatomer subunit zeta